MTTMTTTKSNEPLLNTTLKLFMAAMVLANIAGNMVGSLLPLYLKELNASVVQIGLFFTLSRIFPLVLQIIGGWISDMLGRLRSIAIGSIAGVLSYIGLILAPTWQWVLLSEAWGAMTGSLVGPSFGAFIAEQSSEESRARVYGITETIFMLVVVIGPPLGGWIAGAYSFRIMFIASGALYTIATILRISMARNASQNGESRAERLTITSLRTKLGAMTALMLAGGVITWILITDGVRDIAFSMSFTLMPLYLDGIGGLSILQIGWLSTVFGLFNMATTIPAGWLADKKGERVAIVMGFVLDASAIVVFLKADSFWIYAASWALFGIGVGLMSPAYQSLISKAVPENLRGTAFGFLQTSLGLFSLPAPAVGAQLWDRVGPRSPFAITAWIALLSAIPAWLKFKLPPEERAPGDHLTPDSPTETSS